MIAPLFGTAGIVITIVVGLTDKSAIGFGILIGLVSLGVLGYGVATWSTGAERDKADLEKWEDKRRMFDQGWVCHQCGATWIPEPE